MIAAPISRIVFGTRVTIASMTGWFAATDQPRSSVTTDWR